MSESEERVTNDCPATSYPITVDFPIRFRDIDMMGHVNNAVFITMMEQARVTYCERLAGSAFSRSMGPRGVSYILAAITCHFKAPVKLGAVVRTRVGITDLRRSSFTMSYELADATTGTLVATGTSVQVVYDYDRARSVPIPAALRSQVAALEGWATDDPRRIPPAT
ncbi:MAG: acyl-CoA thioesterase [Deltaproteobacteria bacterium]|nr:acyl-CoA thioesterase [Deltaproteobacteria bacterium]